MRSLATLMLVWAVSAQAQEHLDCHEPEDKYDSKGRICQLWKDHQEDRAANLEWENGRKKKEIQADLCNRLKGVAYRQCWCESDSSGGWRERLCK